MEMDMTQVVEHMPSACEALGLILEAIYHFLTPLSLDVAPHPHFPMALGIP